MKMKTMMMTLMMSLVLLTVSCVPKTSELKVTNEGVTVVKNGRGDNDTIPFTCIGCVENLNYDRFKIIVEECSRITMNNLRNPLSFKPVSVDMIVLNEDSLFDFETNQKIDSVITIIATYKYIGQNAYGTELSGEQLFSFTLVNGQIDDISENIKLDSLFFEDNIINRSLSVYRADDYISITPTKEKNIIVKTSLNCVDEGAIFEITLFSGEEIELRSFNSFNCDGYAFFKFFKKSDHEKIKNSGIKYLYVYSRSKSVMVSVPKNESDYFQQLINLYN
jgi:hypothetical protein